MLTTTRPSRASNGAMTPEQIQLVERSMQALDVDALAADFYRRALSGNPALADMFTTDPRVQRARFAAELAVIVTSIRRFDEFRDRSEALGRRHAGYGVRAPHYRIMGDALLESLAAALGPAWTPAAEAAWRRAYNLTAEAMLAGADPGPG
jgi:hemoglobin-like flavoprotein